MKRVHYIDNYLINPQHPVTVNLIGAGGTGSQVLTCLARLDTEGTRTSRTVRDTV